MLAIYKPQRGERPLWDFPRGTLCHREVAAFEVSEALGWDIVPDTVLRDGPVGIGMMQRFVDHDPEEHYFTLLETHADEFRRMAAFDVVINNTDRKGGHCLRAPRRPHLRHRPRRLVPRAVEAAHRHLGLRRRADPARRVRATCTASPTSSAAATSATISRRCSTASSSTRSAPASSTSSPPASFPDADHDYHSYPWPMI